jgi:hypothetical protein
MGGGTMNQVNIFISYAHADLNPLAGYKTSRVGQILSDIKHHLSCGSSRSRYKILRDVEKTGVSDDFRKWIAAAIAQCDMAWLLLSENYFLSEECTAELERLIELGKPLVPIETEDVQEHVGQYRANLKDLLAGRFWAIEDQKPVLFGFPWPHSEGSNRRQEYSGALESTIRGVKERSKEILAQAKQPEKPSPPERHTVFLACPTSIVRREADRLEKALEADGCSVLRLDPDLDGGDDFEKALTESIATCDLYVQLLGDKPGRGVGRAATPLVVLQHEIATRLEKKIHAWRSPDFDVSECGPDYSAFLNRVESHLTSFEEFERYIKEIGKNAVEQRKSEERRRERQDRHPDGEVSPMVAIDVAEPDYALAQRISAVFGKHVDIETLPFDLDGEAFSTAIADNDAIILGYGPSVGGQRRATAHYKIIRKKNADDRAKHLEIAFGDAASASDPPCPRGPSVHVISVKDEKIDETAMDEFLTRLGVRAVRVQESR